MNDWRAKWHVMGICIWWIEWLGRKEKWSSTSMKILIYYLWNGVIANYKGYFKQAPSSSKVQILSVWDLTNRTENLLKDNDTTMEEQKKMYNRWKSITENSKGYKTRKLIC